MSSAEFDSGRQPWLLASAKGALYLFELSPAKSNGPFVGFAEHLFQQLPKNTPDKTAATSSTPGSS